MDVTMANMWVLNETLYGIDHGPMLVLGPTKCVDWTRPNVFIEPRLLCALDKVKCVDYAKPNMTIGQSPELILRV